MEYYRIQLNNKLFFWICLLFIIYYLLFIVYYLFRNQIAFFIDIVLFFHLQHTQ